MRVRGEYGFSSLLKQNKKAKICFVIYIAGFFFLKFFCSEVFAKQKKTEESSNNYFPKTLKRNQRGDSTPHSAMRAAATLHISSKEIVPSLFSSYVAISSLTICSRVSSSLSSHHGFFANMAFISAASMKPLPFVSTSSNSVLSASYSAGRFDLKSSA